MKNFENEILTLNFKETKNPLLEKRTVSELSDEEMATIDGGSTPICAVTVLTVITLTLTPTPAY